MLSLDILISALDPDKYADPQIPIQRENSNQNLLKIYFCSQNTNLKCELRSDFINSDGSLSSA